MKRKTKQRLAKKNRIPYAIINKLYGDYNGSLEGNIAILEHLAPVIKAHLKRYVRMYPDLCGYDTDVIKDMDELEGTLDYYRDRWNCWHRLQLLVDAPAIYAKFLAESN